MLSLRKLMVLCAIFMQLSASLSPKERPCFITLSDYEDYFSGKECNDDTSNMAMQQCTVLYKKEEICTISAMLAERIRRVFPQYVTMNNSRNPTEKLSISIKDDGYQKESIQLLIDILQELAIPLKNRPVGKPTASEIVLKKLGENNKLIFDLLRFLDSYSAPFLKPLLENALLQALSHDPNFYHDNKDRNIDDLGCREQVKRVFAIRAYQDQTDSFKYKIDEKDKAAVESHINTFNALNKDRISKKELTWKEYKSFLDTLVDKLKNPELQRITKDYNPVSLNDGVLSQIPHYTLIQDPSIPIDESLLLNQQQFQKLCEDIPVNQKQITCEEYTKFIRWLIVNHVGSFGLSCLNRVCSTIPDHDAALIACVCPNSCDFKMDVHYNNMYFSELLGPCKSLIKHRYTILHALGHEIAGHFRDYAIAYFIDMHVSLSLGKVIRPCSKLLNGGVKTSEGEYNADIQSLFSLQDPQKALDFLQSHTQTESSADRGHDNYTNWRLISNNISELLTKKLVFKNLKKRTYNPLAILLISTKLGSLSPVGKKLVYYILFAYNIRANCEIKKWLK